MTGDPPGFSSLSRPSFHFFGGKGGTGKTTCAAATALSAAERGRRVLIVSTDPAHSLRDALGDPRAGLGGKRGRESTPRSLPTRRGTLAAAELDADRALRRWIDRRRRVLQTLAERGTLFDADDIERFLRLSLPGVDELVGLLELRRVAYARPYDHVVVDTAPTGHTLRLLQTPALLERLARVLADLQARHRIVSETLARGYRRDACDALVEEVGADGAALAAMLRDRDRTSFSWITLPEALSIAEARRAIAVLDRDGLAVTGIIVNRVMGAPGKRGRAPAWCAACVRRWRAEQSAIRSLRDGVRGGPLRFLPDFGTEPRGLAALRAVGRALEGRQAAGAVRLRAPSVRAAARTEPPPRAARQWTELLPAGLRLLLFGGKGGVGKSTCATAAALTLAGATTPRRVLLLSTDPAHSLGDVLRHPIGDQERTVAGAPPALRVRELDAGRAFEAQRDRYLAAVDRLFDAVSQGSVFDASYDRAIMRDLIDLAPPGIDEIFGMVSIMDALLPEAGADTQYDLVVLDTAPTGHALRLLEMPSAAQEWVRVLLAILLKYRELTGLGDLAESLVALSRGLRGLLALLSDPARTRFVAVTRAAALPRAETLRLVRALDRLRIPLAGVLVNAVTGAGCDRCAGERSAEQREIKALAAALASRRSRKYAMILAPAVAPPPRGVRVLRQWERTWRVS